MAKAKSVPAPKFFLKRVKEAEKLLEQYRGAFPKLKLEYDFDTKLSSEKIDQIISDEDYKDIQYAKFVYESLWQLAKKEFYYYCIDWRDRDFTYDEKKEVITEVLRVAPRKTK